MVDKQLVPRETPQLIEEQVERLREIFPEAFTEGKVDFDKLRDTLGEIVDDRPERYSFSWAGKRDATKLLQTPSGATLAPVPKESVNFDETQNVFVEGENLEVLKLLYKSYYGRVKMIYIDPPYNTGNDFIYPDNYADPLETYLQITGQRDAEGNLLTTNPETSGRYHSNWLSMMYPRLFLARQLLREDGAIFITIGEEEVHNLRLLMNEIFGEENFVTTVIWRKKVSPANDAQWFSGDHDYILVYARSKQDWVLRRLLRTEAQRTYYTNPDNDPRGPWNSATYTCNKSKDERPNLYYPITNPNTGEETWPDQNAVWAYSQEMRERHAAEERIYWGKDGASRSPRLKLFLKDARDVVPRSVWDYSDVGHTQEATREYRSLCSEVDFDTAKPSRLIERMIHIGTSPPEEAEEPELVMDFFAGSCTTAQAVLQKNAEEHADRRFIMVQIPEHLNDPQTLDDGSAIETIADIGKERIRRVIQNMAETAQDTLDLPDRDQPEDLGFRVFHLQESNLQPWQPVPADDEEAVVNQLQRQIDPLREGWTEQAVIAEVAVKEGFGLNYRVETLDGITANCVYRVTDPDRQQTIYACLDEHLETETWEGLDLTENDLLICRDTALDDTQAANIALQCRLHTI